MPDDPISRLVLGTAQLGMNYGVANRSGQPTQHQADRILSLAHREGVRWLDTAQAYGSSEAVLGDFLHRHPQCDFAVISKLAPHIDADDADAIVAAVQESYRLIGRQLEAILIHNAAALERWHGSLGTALRRCVGEGWVKALGVSVYSPEELAGALELTEIEVIQAPFNVFDRRIACSGVLERARKQGKRIFLRSAFLQGLLLIEPGDLPDDMSFADTDLRNWRQVCARHGIAPQVASLKFVIDSVPDASLVVGCETAQQLAGIVAALRSPPIGSAFMKDLDTLPQASERLINPQLWDRSP